MFKFVRPEYLLMFLLGVASIATFETILSYHASNCSYQQQGNRPSAPNDKNPSATHKADDGGHEKKNKTVSEPFACSIAGFPSAIRQFMNHNEGFFVGGFTFMLVFVTSWLVWATLKLWQAGENQRKSSERIAERQRRSSQHIAARQLHSMRNANEAAYASVKAAQTSADAAKASADMAVAAERARFFIVIPDQNIGDILSDFVRPPDPPGYFIMRPVTKDTPPRIGYRFKNYGKTPAIIKEISLGGEISTDPVEPVYSTIIHNFPENTIGYGEMTKRDEFGHPQRLTSEEAGVISRNERRYWFFGKIDYEDVFGNPHTHRFYFRTVALGRKCILQPYDFKHYNQST